MRAPLLFLLAAALAAGPLAGEEALPQRQVGETGEAEPKLFLNDLGAALPAPGGGAGEELNVPRSALEASATVDAARASLERARRQQARWQRLARAGVLSAVEAEGCALQVSRAVLKYETARLELQKQQLADLRQRAASAAVAPDLLATAEASVQSAQTMADEAAAALQRTRLLQAQSNLDRQRRLYAAGVGSKNQLKRAEATLQQVKAPPAAR